MTNQTIENSTPVEEIQSIPFYDCFAANHQPPQALLKLLQLVGMDTSQTSPPSIQTIKDWTQKNLIRNGERWEQQITEFELLKPDLILQLKKLGFTDPIYPSFNCYQGAILHGALLPTVRFRLYWLVELWKQGIRFTDLYFLSGQRPLHTEIENLDAIRTDTNTVSKIEDGWVRINTVPTSESEMMQCVWEQAQIPPEMRCQVRAHFISAPMKISNEAGTLVRPNTEDTVIEWLKTFPLYGRYLSVSNAPYVRRQGLITQMLANENYLIDPTGPGIKGNEKMAILLDELARFIYTIPTPAKSK